MINYKNTILLFLLVTASLKIMAQANPTINVLPGNSGIVAVGATLDLQIDIGNTGVSSIAVAKLRPNIAVPGSVTFLPNADQTGLPAGWTILTNSGSQLRFCNTSFVVPEGSITTITLKVRGVTVAPPQTFQGTINFGNGTTCAAGTSVSGDQLGDNNATSTIEVIAGTLPLTLLNFNAALVNCKTSLNWATASEINTDRFEIERNDEANANAGWKTVAEVNAKGILPKSTYNYSDATLDAASVKVFYRLKIIDKDGSYKYSDIVPLSVNCKTSQVAVFPNPVRNGKVNVTLSGTTGITEAVIMSAAGQQVLKAKIINGTNFLNVSNVTDGVYYLHIKEANGADKKVKLLIQK